MAPSANRFSSPPQDTPPAGPPNMPPPPDYPPSGYQLPYPPPGYGRGFYPLDLGRIWALTFSMYRFRFKTFAAISLILFIPVAIVTSILAVISLNSLGSWTNDLARRMAAGDVDPATIFNNYPWANIGISLLTSIVVAVVSYVVVAAITVAMMNTFVGAKASVADSLRAALRMFGRLGLLYLASFAIVLAFFAVGALVITLALLIGSGQPGLVIFIGLVAVVALVVLFLHVFMRLQLALPTLIIEGVGARQALRRSWMLARGSLWRIFGYVLLFGIVAAIPAAIVSALLGGLARPTVQTLSPTDFTLVVNPVAVFGQSLIAAIVAALFTPITTLSLTLLYLDIRSRHGEAVPTPGAQTPVPTQPT